MALPNEPITRAEQYLAKIAGQDVDLPAEPVTRTEKYLAKIAENGGGGDGSEITDFSLDGNTLTLSTSDRSFSVDLPSGGLDASGTNAGEVPTADGNNGWAWAAPANPLAILNMTSSGLLPVNAALFAAFQPYVQAAVTAPGTMVRASQSVNTDGFMLALGDVATKNPVALQFSAGAGSEMLLTVTAISQGCAALRVAMAYTIENVGTFDLAGDVIIGNNKVIIMGYALAEEAAG